ACNGADHPIRSDHANSVVIGVSEVQHAHVIKANSERLIECRVRSRAIGTSRRDTPGHRSNCPTSRTVCKLTHSVPVSDIDNSANRLYTAETRKLSVCADTILVSRCATSQCAYDAGCTDLPNRTSICHLDVALSVHRNGNRTRKCCIRSRGVDVAR